MWKRRWGGEPPWQDIQVDDPATFVDYMAFERRASGFTPRTCMAPVPTVLFAFYHHVDSGDAHGETPANGSASSACYRDALICRHCEGLRHEWPEYGLENVRVSHQQRSAARDHGRWGKHDWLDWKGVKSCSCLSFCRLMPLKCLCRVSMRTASQAAQVEL